MLDHRIETFLILCETLNYTKAAKKLCMTQPAVTQHVKYLENYYQCSLFQYEGKQLFITAKGRELQQYAMAMRSNIQKIYDRISHEKEGQIHIRLGATKSIADYIIPKAITNYMLEDSTRLVDLSTENTEKLLQRLKDGEIDIAVVEGSFNKLDYEFELLREEPFFCVAAPEYVNEHADILEKLFCYRLIVREQGSGTRSILEDYLKEHCYDISCFENRMEVDNFMSIKEMVEAGLGITFVYQMVVEEELQKKRLVQLEIPGMPTHRALYFVYSKESLFQQEYQSFIQAFRKAMKTGPLL